MKALLSAAAAFAMLGLWEQPAQAQVEAQDELIPLSDDDLAEMRGGFLMADGVTFDFAATVHTTVNGVQVMDSRVTWTPQGAKLETLSGMTPRDLASGGVGITLKDSSGLTTIGHRLLEGELQGFILNTADNRTVTHNIDVTLTLPGFDMVQSGMVQALTGMRLSQDVANALLGAGR